MSGTERGEFEVTAAPPEWQAAAAGHDVEPRDVPSPTSSVGTEVGSADLYIERFQSQAARLQREREGERDSEWESYSSEVAVDGHTQHESVAAARGMTTPSMLACITRCDIARNVDGRGADFYIDVTGDRSQYTDVPSINGTDTVRVFVFDMIHELWGALDYWVYDRRHEITSLMRCSEQGAYVLDRLAPGEMARMSSSGVAEVARSVLTALRTNGIKSLGVYTALDRWGSMSSPPAVIPTRGGLLDTRLSTAGAGRIHFGDVMGVAWPSARAGLSAVETLAHTVWPVRLQNIWVGGPALAGDRMWNLAHSDFDTYSPVVDHVSNLRFGGGTPVRETLRRWACSFDHSPVAARMHARLVEVREALVSCVSYAPMRNNVIALLSAPGAGKGAYLRCHLPVRGVPPLHFAANGDRRADMRVPPAALMTEQLDELLAAYAEHDEQRQVVATTPWTLVVHAVALFMTGQIDRGVFAGVLRKVQSCAWLTPRIVAVHTDPQDNMGVIGERDTADDTHVTAETLHAASVALLLVCDVLEAESRCGCRVLDCVRAPSAGRSGGRHLPYQASALGSLELHVHLDRCVVAICAHGRDHPAPGRAGAAS